MHDPSRLRHTISLQAGWEPPHPGRAGWSRRFGRPLDLPRDERVVLVIAPGPGAASDGGPAGPTLNGSRLAVLPAARALAAPASEPVGGAIVARDVTDVLGGRNELRFAVDDASAAERSEDGAGRHRPLPVAVARVWLEVQAAPEERSAAADHS